MKFFLVYQTEEKIYKMNFIEKIDKNLKADVKNKEINQNLIEIDMINEEFKDNELKIIDSNKQNLDEIKLKDQNSRDILEFNVSNLLINQGTNQFLIYQENLTRIKEANIDFIHGTIIKILPKNVL